MPVPALLTDLSTTISNNSPPGSETVGTNLDDYLRAGFGLLAQVNANKLDTTTASATYAPLASPTFTGTVTGTFSGSGASLTSLNATQLTSGTVPSARVAGAYTAVTAIGNTTSALSFSTAGNATFAAPASGVTVTINGFATSPNELLITSSTDTAAYFNGPRVAIQNSSNTSGNYGAISFVAQGGSDAAAIWSKITTHTTGATVASLSLATNNGSSVATERLNIAAPGNFTFNAPASGVPVTMNTQAVGQPALYLPFSSATPYYAYLIDNANATGYAGFQLRANGVSKFIRADYLGNVSVINSANNTVLFNVSDTGNTTVAGTLTLNSTTSATGAITSPNTPKAWCTFNGTTAGTNAPLSGYNVTSVTRNSTGNYTVNLTTATASNAACVASSNGASGGHIAQAYPASTTAITVLNIFPNVGVQDDSFISLIVYSL